MLSIATAATKLGLSRPTAGKCLQRLEELGIVRALAGVFGGQVPKGIRRTRGASL